MAERYHKGITMLIMAIEKALGDGWAATRQTVPNARRGTGVWTHVRLGMGSHGARTALHLWGHGGAL